MAQTRAANATRRRDESPRGRSSDVSGPHQDQQLVTAGAPLSVADAAAVVLHGRGATARGVVTLAEEFYRHGLALVAPQAERNRWFPASFLAPREANEPWLSSALAAVGDAIDFVNEQDIPSERTLLFGVSQGGCLAAEWVVRNPRRYGGVAISSGGLLGPAGTNWDVAGSLENTPTLVGGSSADPRVPVDRLDETIAVFERLDADVTERIDDAEGHGITDAELAIVDGMVAALLPAAEEGERT